MDQPTGFSEQKDDESHPPVFNFHDGI